jgi:hypothetical protein
MCGAHSHFNCTRLRQARMVVCLRGVGCSRMVHQLAYLLGGITEKGDHVATAMNSRQLFVGSTLPCWWRSWLRYSQRLILTKARILRLLARLKGSMLPPVDSAGFDQAQLYRRENIYNSQRHHRERSCAECRLERSCRAQQSNHDKTSFQERSRHPVVTAT